MVNKLPIRPNSKNPRAILTLNGTRIEMESLIVNNNNVYNADTFQAKLVLSKMPPEFIDEYFASVPAVLVNIYAGFPNNPQGGKYTASELTPIFIGQIDNIEEFNYWNQTLTISGRDLTSNFIDNKTSEKFQNLTASEVITLLAKRRGLTPVVTPTTTKVGIFYQNNITQINDEKTEWDLMIFLAQQENFFLYVDGLNLVFKPKPDDKKPTFIIQRQKASILNGYDTCNVVNPVFSRTLTLAKDIIVKVRTWNISGKKGYTATATATHNKKTVISGKAQPVGKAQTYSFEYPGLTPAQANQKAQQILREQSQHELNLDFSMPGDISFKKDAVIQTKGFCESFNQVFYPDSIRQTMIFGDEAKYLMQVHAKNHSPISTVLS